MMGRNDKPQKPLFYAFNLDELVPQDHLLRKIATFLDLSDLHEHLARYYCHTGRPSVDPELMIRMLIIGYCLGIRSERRLRDQVKQYWTSGWQARSRMSEASTLRYHALKKDCEGCALKEQCCPNTHRRAASPGMPGGRVAA